VIGDEISEEVFDLVGPVIATAVVLITLKEQLKTLNELSSEVMVSFREGQWSPEMIRRFSTDIKHTLTEIRREMFQLEQRLPS
jgi:hypothetical protein